MHLGHGRLTPRRTGAICENARFVLFWSVKWYYAVGDKPLGPVTRAELETLFDAGTITTTTLVTQEGMLDWVPYVDLKKTTQFLPSFGVKVKLDKEEPSPPEPQPPVPAAEASKS